MHRLGTPPEGSPERVSSDRLAVDIVCEHDAWRAVAGLDEAIAEAADLAYRRSGCSEGAAEVVIALLSDHDVQVLNHQFRGLDKPTNVLSFPASESLSVHEPGEHGLPIGDLALAFETVEREAQERAIAIGDHIRHLVVHGVLHLLGYDHLDDDEAEAMEALETRILAELGIADPYAGDEPAARVATTRATP